MNLCRKIDVGIFLTVLYLALCSFSTLFFHTHIIDGQEVTHSHPFGQSDHSHSHSELNLLDSLLLIVFVVPSVAVLAIGVIKFFTVNFIAYSEKILCFKGLNASLRAPPVC